MKRLNGLKEFVEKVFERMQEVDISDAAAALSYRSLIAIVPAIAISVTVSGLVLGREKVLRWFFSLLEDVLGTEAIVLERAVEGTFDTMSGFLFSFVILVIFVWASVSLVDNARKTFYSIFNLGIKASDTLRLKIKSRFISSLYTILIFVLIIFIIVVQPIMSATFGVLGHIANGVDLLILRQLIQLTLSFSTALLVFSLIYWFMSSGTLYFRSIILGGVFSSGLFLLFNTFLSLYFSYSYTLGLFGASGFILVLLIWLYYFAYTLFLGGVVAFVFDNEHRKKRERDKVVYI